MNTCSTCKHWRERPEFSRAPKGTGVCGAIQEMWEQTAWVEDKEDDYRHDFKPEVTALAFVQDGSDYLACLIIKPEFGCVMHEAKEDL